MKQTAVEWLVEQLSNYDLKMIELFKKEINQAKELEKQQIIDAYINGMYKGQEVYFSNEKIKLDVNHLNYSVNIAEQYYNETFKKTIDE